MMWVALWVAGLGLVLVFNYGVSKLNASWDKDDVHPH